MLSWYRLHLLMYLTSDYAEWWLRYAIHTIVPCQLVKNSSFLILLVEVRLDWICVFCANCIRTPRRMHKTQTIATVFLGLGICQCEPVTLSVCLPAAFLCKCGWTDRDPVWSEDSWGPKEQRVRTFKFPPRIRYNYCHMRLFSITLNMCAIRPC